MEEQKTKKKKNRWVDVLIIIGIIFCTFMYFRQTINHKIIAPYITNHQMEINMANADDISKNQSKINDLQIEDENINILLSDSKGNEIIITDDNKFYYEDGTPLKINSKGQLVDKYNQVVINNTAKFIKNHEKEKKERLNKKIKRNHVIRTNDPNVYYDPASIQDINYMPLDAKLNKNYIISKIYYPHVGLNLPVLEGLTNANLNIASGTMKPNQVLGKGNYAIAGHRMLRDDLLFSPLQYGRKGDIIYLSDKHKVYEYKITNIYTTKKQNGNVILDSEGNGLLTLVTCTDIYGTARLITRAEIIKEYPISKASTNLKNALAK